jgi:hypothetical protein
MIRFEEMNSDIIANKLITIFSSYMKYISFHTDNKVNRFYLIIKYGEKYKWLFVVVVISFRFLR